MADKTDMEDQPDAKTSGETKMICRPCAQKLGVLFEGKLYYGECDECHKAWIDIVEVKQ